MDRFSFDSDWGNWRGMQWRPYIYKYNPKVILIPKDWQEFLLQTSDPIKSPQLIKPMEK